MKRLIDEDFGPDASEHWLGELVRAAPPLAPAPLLRSKVLAYINHPGPVRHLWLGKAVAVAATLGVAAVATAGAERLWLRGHDPAAPVLATGEGVVATMPRPVSMPPKVVEPAVGLLAPPPASALARPSAVERNPERSPLRPSRRSEARMAAKSGEDPALVLEAIRALRNRGDGVRAGSLLADYLKAHPNGVLVEDATALSIEAALARHDEGAARELARRYVTQFPNGRYRAFAKQATQTIP